MSAKNSPPLNGDAPYDEARSGSNSIPSTPGKPVRTIAIIKNHALDHRFDIERKIQEASFEIVKERQMEFDMETDPEFMYELFGDDADSFAEGPVWVYVLERRRAVESFISLMGHRDPEVARKDTPGSLRALYGKSIKQNAIMGSPNAEAAEAQINALFASSPPFPTSDLADESRFSTLKSVDSSVLSELRRVTSNSTGGATSNVTSGGSNNSKTTANGKQGFKARALPATHIAPDIAPRTTKAAALRAGAPLVKNGVYQTSKAREALSKDRLAETFANVPGHKRAESIAVASTAAPTIAPRMTRAASLRIGGQSPSSPVKRAPSAAEKKVISINEKETFQGVPGHKRRETITVASTQAPTVAPRTNRSAALRATKEAAPPTSFMFKKPSQPGLSRSNSQSNLSPSRPNLSRPASAASSRPATLSRATSSTIPLQDANGTNGTSDAPKRVYGTDSGIPFKPAPRPSSIDTPTIVPRTNKSAALRAAKKAEEEAAAAAAARRYGRPKPRPSSVTVV